MSDIDELVRTLSDSVPVSDEIERAAAENARKALRAATRAEAARSGPPWSSRRLAGLAIAGALAIALVAIAALLPGGASNEAGHAGAPLGSLGTTLGPAPASAEVLLVRAAHAIAREPWHQLRPGEWLYFRYYQGIPDRNGPAPTRPNGIEDAWIAGNGAARLVQRGFGPVGGQVLLFGATTRDAIAEQQIQRRGPHLKVMAYGQPYSWGGPTPLDYKQLIHLPTDPRKLERWIEQQAPFVGGPARDGRIFSVAEALISQAPLPPQLSAALYRVIARLPEMRVIGPTRDPLGRPGIAVGFLGGSGAREELIFNPHTGAYLAKRGISLTANSGTAPGTVQYWER